MKKFSYLTAALVVFSLAAIAIPGQAKADTIMFTATLSGANEVTPINSTAIGSAVAVLDTISDQLFVTVDFSGLESIASAATIQVGAPGTNGPVVSLLAGLPFAASGSFTALPVNLTPLQISELESSLLYVNIHDTTLPAGEIRGQLVSATSSTGTGTGSTVPEPSTGSLIFTGAIVAALALCLRKLKAAFKRRLNSGIA
jgi:hypothetical protein